ncbi:MAG: helicase HerA-like domain-containing protein, partial [Cytophagales bacterium]
FTPNDVKALKETVKTFPTSAFYDMEKQFTQLGIGQAFVTVLNEKGIPTETVTVHLAPPASLMGPLSEFEYKNLLESSDMYKKYKDTVDPESAFEILSEKVKASQQKQEEEEQEEQRAKEEAVETKSGRTGKSTLEKVLTSPITNQIGKSLVRGVFGVLFGTPPRQTRRRGW